MKLLMYFAVSALSLSLTVPALADTLVTTPAINGNLPGIGTATGSLTFDSSIVPNSNTHDFITGLSFSVDGDSFTSVGYQALFDGEYYVASQDSAQDVLLIGIPVADLSSLGSEGFSGYCVAGSGCDYTSYFMENGQSAVQFTSLANAPEPSSLVLLGTGVLGLLGAARRRFVRA